METVATELKPSKTVEVIRGQYHKFKLIPILNTTHDGSKPGQ